MRYLDLPSKFRAGRWQGLLSDLSPTDRPACETILFDRYFACMDDLVTAVKKHSHFMIPMKNIPMSDAKVTWYCLGEGLNEARIESIAARKRIRISPVPEA